VLDGGAAQLPAPSADVSDPAAADGGLVVDGGAVPAPLLPPAEPAPALPVTAAPGSLPAAAIEPVPMGSNPGSSRDEPIDVTVVGTRLSRTAGSAHVISQKQLERFEYDDPTAVLLATPGLYVRTEDGMGLRPNIGLRGVNPDRSKKVTLLEDGVLFGPAPYSAPAAYYFPLITRMTGVRVIKGPGAISYGPQTVAGAIDFITRPIPEQTASGVDVAVGQYGYGKAHVYAGASTEQFGFLIEGVRLQSDGFKELPDGADTGFARNEWMVKGSYVVDPDAEVRNELRLKLTYSDEISNESYLGLTDADFEKNPNARYGASQLDRMKNHRVSIVLTHLLEASPKLKLTTNVYRHAFSRSWRKVNGYRGAGSLFDVLNNPESGSVNPEVVRSLRGEATSAAAGRSLLVGPNERNFESAGIESRLRWDHKRGRLTHRLEVGARYHYDYIDRRHSENGYQILGDELYPDGGPTVVTAYNRESMHAVALHAQYALTLYGLTLTPGLRAELLRASSKDRLTSSDGKDFNYGILPGVGAYYALFRGLGVLAGVYRGFSPPLPGSGPDVEPEKSTNYEGGLRYTAGPLRLESVGFYNDYENLTDYCTQSSGCEGAMVDTQYDAGEARIYGVEVLADHELRLREYKLPLSLAYTFTRAEFLQSFRSQDPIFGNVRKGDEIPYVPEHQLRAQVGVEHPGGGLNLAVTYVGAMREVPGTGSLDRTIATDAQFIVDAAAQAKIWGPLSLYANIQNLLDSRYIVSRRPFGARPNAPRWAHVGLKAAF